MPTAIAQNRKDSAGKSSVCGVSLDYMENAPEIAPAAAGNCRPWTHDRHPLYWLRKEKGLTLGELGNLSGLRAAQIQLYENGMQPRIENAFRLARALGVTVDKLFGIPYKKLARETSE